MISLPFEVNSSTLRREFINKRMFECLQLINEKTEAQWGKMTARHMIEHLIFAFGISTGKKIITREIPEKILPRLQKFLYNNEPTPIEFQNPVLGPDPPAYIYDSLGSAITVLSSEIEHFYIYYKKYPGHIHNHPVFGPLGAEGWERAHYKHCFHHLLQFALIKQENMGIDPI